VISKETSILCCCSWWTSSYYMDEDYPARHEV